MNVSILYRKIKQILNDSNIALINQGHNGVDNLFQILEEIEKAGGVNYLPSLFRDNITELSENNLGRICKIKDYAFYRRKSIRNIIIPDSVTTIGESAFNGCEYLTSITIGNSVTSIGKEAFCNCWSLTSITIPGSVTSIGSIAFQNCTRLTDIYLNSLTPPSLSNTSAIPTRTTIHVPIGSGEAYKSATNWSYHSTRIVDDVTV